MTKLLVVGGGKMGEALLGGLLKAGWTTPGEVVVVEPDAVRAEEVRSAHSVAVVTSIATALAAHPRIDGALVAVKPQTVAAVCAELAGHVGRVLSIAAGVTIASIEAALADGTPVIRSMPNTPALVGRGASAIAGGASATAVDLDWAAEILGAVGVVERVSESLLNAVTGLSGSGPAYVFLVAEALVDGAVAQGIPRSVAVTLAHQTIAGAGQMLVHAGDQAATLRANVTSPGGTTAAGLRALEERGVRSAFIEAIGAATERARELG